MPYLPDGTPYILEGNGGAGSGSQPAISTYVSVGTGGSVSNPYYGVDIASLDAQQYLAYQEYLAQQLGLPVAALDRDAAIQQANQSVDSAKANAKTALSANQAQRLGVLNQIRQKQRDMQLIPPSLAAGYRGSQWIDPNAVAGRDDANAALGILNQQGSVIDNQDSQVNLGLTQAVESAGTSRNLANARYTQQAANIGLSKPSYDARLTALNAQRFRALFNGTSVGQGHQGGTYGSGVGQGSTLSRANQASVPAGQSQLGSGEYGSAFGENGFFNGGDGGLPWNSAYRQGGAFANSGWF